MPPSTTAPFSGGHDFVATVERLIAAAEAAADERAVRVFAGFHAAADGGLGELLWPRVGENFFDSPICGGPLLHECWEPEVADLHERICEAGVALPPDASERERHDARYFEDLAEAMWACFTGWRAPLQEAYVGALRMARPGAREEIAAHEAYADELRAHSAWRVAEHNCDEEALKRAEARKRRAHRRANRAFGHLAALSRPRPPATPHHRRRGHAPRTATNGRARGARRAAGVRAGQDPGDPDPESEAPAAAEGVVA